MKNAIRTAALLTILLAVHSPANAADEYKWIGQVTEEGASLSYAIPESDAIKIDFHCERKTRKIVVSFEHEPKTAKDGVRLATRLSVRGREAGTLDLVMTGQRLEFDDKFLLQGEIRMGPQLRRILAEGGTLVVEVDGQMEEIPLKSVAQAARQLLASCPG